MHSPFQNEMLTFGKSKNPIFTTLRRFTPVVIFSLAVSLIGTLNGWCQGQVNFDTKAVGAPCYFCQNNVGGIKMEGDAWLA